MGRRQSRTGASEQNRPYYEIVRTELERNIRLERLPRDVVLLEGQLASLLGVSREPVKRALDLLARDGLVHRFDGRGYVVGPPGRRSVPKRLDLRALDLDITIDIQADGPRAIWQKIHGAVAESVIACIPFGTYQISEAVMCRHFGVSRTVVRDVLNRLDQDGLVEKDRWSHWTAGPLTARDVNDRFELRANLEPLALRTAAPALDPDLLRAMRARLAELAAAPADAVRQADVDQFERDLHETLLCDVPNRRLVAAIRQNQLPAVINRLFGTHVGVHDVAEISREHALVFDHLLAGAADAAAEALARHIRLDRLRTLARLKVLSVIPDPPAAPYLSRLGGTSSPSAPIRPRRPPAPRIRRDKVMLRVIGRSEILLAEIRRQAAEDLDLDIRFELVDGLAASQRATTRPDSFDVYHQGHTVDLIWTARSIRPIDLRRIPAWSEVAQLAELGEGKRRIFRDVFEQVYVQEDGRLGGRPTERASMLPAVHGVDAPGYLPIVRAELAAGEADSWAWLLDDRWRGRVALLSDASLGMIEAALAAEASGLAEFRSMANLSIEEIDAIVGILTAKKRAGHFRALWETYDEAVALMEKGEVAIQSIFSPTVIELQRRGVAVRTAVPSEGYRGWHSDLCISARAQGATLDAAYAYLNWWMEGAAGAMLARQGYYASTRERARRYLSVGEWEYWYEGKPASQELAGAGGRGSIAVGSLRDGGSYFARMSGVRVWNTFMDEHNYLTRRWNDFLAA